MIKNYDLLWSKEQLIETIQRMEKTETELQDKLHRRNMQIKSLTKKIETLTPMKCCLCGNDIEIKHGWKEGNNALPLKDGRCCDACNLRKVLPARFKKINR
jgi:hypothetical protein